MQNTEGKWETVEYRLLPEDPADTQAVLEAVLQIRDETDPCETEKNKGVL